MTKKFATVLIAILLIIAGLVTYRIVVNKEKAAENAAGRGQTESKVYGIVVSGRPFSNFLSLSGAIEPNEVINLRSEISGIVETLNFSEGGSVSNGQTLIKINDAELR